MNTGKLVQLGIAEIRSRVAEELYLTTGVDFSRPSSIVATVNEICNYRCPMCMHWRPEFPRTSELSAAQWKEVLGGLHEFIGPCSVAFIGGEPFIKPGFLDILEFCHDHEISHSTTTNGSLLLRADTIPRLVNSAPAHLNISVDGPTPEVHDRSRGVAGSLHTIERAIHALCAEQERTAQRFPIRIKTTIHAWNYRSMPAMAEWVARVGASTVDFEPVRRWTPEVDNDLWVEQDQINDLKEVMEELVSQKRDGQPIETSEHRLLGMPDQFSGRGSVAPEVTPCRVGLRRFAISTNGDVTTCWFFDPIGNIVGHNAREIWTSPAAAIRRQETVACKKACAYSCMAQKPLKNLVDRGLLMISAARKQSRASSAGVRG